MVLSIDGFIDRWVLLIGGVIGSVIDRLYYWLALLVSVFGG